MPEEEEEEELEEEELPQTNSEQVKQVVDNASPEGTAGSTGGGRSSNLASVVTETVRSLENQTFLSWLNRINLRKSLLAFLIILVILSVLLLLTWFYKFAFGDAVFKDFINLIGVFISWPVIVIIALLILYKPLSNFLESLGQNNQNVKVSIFQFALEVSKASEFTPKWSMSGVDLRFAEGNEITSSGMPSLFQQFQGDQSLDYAIIDIGNGKQWLTSRLFVFAIMLERVRGLRCLVFVETTPDAHRRFLGIASPSEIRWRLAMLQPWLDPSFARAVCFTQYVQGWAWQAFNPGPVLPTKPFSPHHILSVQGGVNVTEAEETVRAFLNDPNIQQKSNPPTDLDDGNWEEVKPLDKSKSPFWEHAKWINKAWIQKLDLKHDEDTVLKSNPDDSRVKQTQAILRRKGAFITLVNENKEFKELIDRQSLLENVVTNLNNLPDGRVDAKQ